MVEGEMNWEELEVNAIDCVLSRWIAKEKNKWSVLGREHNKTKSHIYIILI